MGPHFLINWNNNLSPFLLSELIILKIRQTYIWTSHSRPQKMSLWQVIQVTCSSCARHGTQFSIDLPTIAMMSHNVHQVFIILGDTSTSHYISMIPWALDDPHVAKFPNMIRSDSDVCYSGIGWSRQQRSINLLSYSLIYSAQIANLSNTKLKRTPLHV